MTFLLLVAVAVMFWLKLSKRSRELETRISALSQRLDEHAASPALHALHERVARLEDRLATSAPQPAELVPPASVGPVAVPQPAPPQVAPVPSPLAEVVLLLKENVPPAPRSVPAPDVVRAEVKPVTPPLPVHPPSPQPSVIASPGDRPQASRRPELPVPPRPRVATKGQEAGRKDAEDWEATIGGSWLNKVGVIVLVIGIALFLGYSLTRMGPAGRVGIGLAVSAAMLALGVVTERRAQYKVFGRGLIGGGWAALYFTTYAMHGLEAARVIDSPLVGTALLLAVASAIVGHSLKYRSQVITGLAFFVTFTTLAISPVTAFAAAASVPLTLALLYLARRFVWLQTAVLGLVATYSVYLLHFSTASAPSLGAADFFRTHIVLAIYWAVFEGFDLINLRSRRGNHNLAATIFPLNACGFLGSSILLWTSPSAHAISAFCAVTAGAYLLSAIVRTCLRPPLSGVETEATPALDHTYFGATAIAATLALVGILLRFDGLRATMAVLLEGEFAMLSGLLLRQRFLRALAVPLLGVAVARLLGIDIPATTSTVAVAGISVHVWAPVMLLFACVMWVNRELLRLAGDSELLLPETVYSYAGTFLIAGLLAAEVAVGYRGIAWLLLGIALLEIGMRRGLEEFKIQSQLIGALGLLAIAAFNIPGIDESTRWRPLAPAAAIAYACSVRVAMARRGLRDEQRSLIRDAVSGCGTLFLAAWVAHRFSIHETALIWLLLTWPLFEIGLWSRLAAPRVQGYLIGAAGLFALASAVTGTAAWWDAIGKSAGLSYLLAVRFELSRRAGLGDGERSLVRDAASWAGTFLATLWIGHTAAREHVGLMWLLAAIPLFETGVRSRIRSLRLQSYLTGAFGLGALFAVNAFGWSLPAGDIPWRQLIPGAGLAFAAGVRLHLASPERIGTVERRIARDVAFWSATLLTMLLFWQALPEIIIALGWLTLGVLLVEIGIATGLVGLRLQGYLVVALAIGRLFFLNFTAAGVTAFGVPGATWQLSHRFLTVAPTIASLYHLVGLLRASHAVGRIRSWERTLVVWCSHMAAFLTVILLRFEMGRALAVLGWALFLLLLLALGVGRAAPRLRLQAYVIAAFTFTRGLTTSFYVPESLAGDWIPLVSASVVIACFYAAHWIAMRASVEPGVVHDSKGLMSWFDRHAGTWFSLFATILLTQLVFREAPLRLLTVAWGIEGVALLTAGFSMRDRSLRLSGLTLLGVCVLKVFFHDFRQLDTMARILSFVGLGLGLIVASWIYSRYRDLMHRYL